MSFESVLEKAAEEAAKYNKINPGDYFNEVDGGLLYCGNCHTRKQRITAIPNKGPMLVFCICECEAERRSDEARQRQIKADNEKIAEMNRNCFLSPFMRQFRLEQDDKANPDATEAAHRYIANYPENRDKGRGLLLYGPVGTGKTFLACAILNELMAHNIPCKMINLSDMANRLSQTFNKGDVYDELDSYDVLFIDDLGAERDTSYMAEIAENIIDARYRNRQPVIVTTNFTETELAHPTNINRQRMISRLVGSNELVFVGGKDRRKDK